MKKAYLLLSLSLISIRSYSDSLETPTNSEAFITLTRTALPSQSLPTNTETVTPQDFYGWSAETAGQAVQRMTSVQVLPAGGLGTVQTPQIRGASTSQNLLQVDGRPVGGIAFGASQDMTEIPPEAIDRIEVVRGGVSALYGPNAMGGVINVITRRGSSFEKPAAVASYDYGSYGRNIFRASAGGKSGPVDVFFYGDTQHEGGFRQNSLADTLNVGGNVGVALPASSKLTADISEYQSEVGVPGQVFIPTNQFNNDAERLATTPHAKENTDTKALRLAYQVPLPLDTKLTLKAWGSQRRVLYKDDFSDTSRFEGSHGTEAQWDLPYGFVVGGDLIHDREDSTDHLTPSNTFIRSAENYAFFAQDTLNWNRFTVIPSGRFDHHSAFGNTANPRVQALAEATPWLRFSGSSARSFRAPTIDDLYTPFTDFGSFADPFSGRYTDYSYQGNPGLKPETAWTYDAGFELHNDQGSFKATYFRANVTNLIQTINTFTAFAGTLAHPDTYASQTINVGKARRQGLEIQINHDLNAYFKDGWNYTYLENLGIPVGATRYVTLANSPRHKANWFGTFSPTKYISWTNTLRYESSRYSQNAEQGDKLGSMVLWDMRLGMKWKALEPYFQVNDILDRRYEEQDGYPLPGRTFIGGVQCHFW